MTEYLHFAHNRSRMEPSVFRYSIINNSSGEKVSVGISQIGSYFEVIRNLTGLDRPMAQQILTSRGEIEHPAFTFVQEKSEAA